ncbi:hypothetical protein FB451DRAFT_292171 [Mycena latifolia]|nr:hypothetical protein FB451DRAFT_292171 [Mycena latifolia]
MQHANQRRHQSSLRNPGYFCFSPHYRHRSVREACRRSTRRGFLYAAATPLSMFGSLGIVKASTSILVASISPRFAQMLADSGFQLEGSVAAMIGAPLSKRDALKRRTARTQNSEPEKDENKHISPSIASQKFQELLEEQHIDKSQVRLKFDYRTWNWQLCISTALLACLSISPYVRIIMSDHPSKGFPTWVPPLLRIVGSAVSVGVAQMIIQIRMQQILQSILDPTQVPEPNSDSETALHDLEQGIWNWNWNWSSICCCTWP